MSVWMMCQPEESGAIHVPHWDSKVQKWDDDKKCHIETEEIHKIYIQETYKGCVVNTSERNGYHDSDFYVTVWDETKGEFRTFEYASTRGWCYPNNATIDASTELMERYNKHLANIRESARQARINMLAQPFKDAGIPDAFIPELIRFPEPQRIGLEQLLKVKNFRSEFRKSLKEQLLKWLETPIPERKYNSPFSPKQWDSILRYDYSNRYKSRFSFY